MSALRDLQEYIREDFDRVLSACESYTRAEEKLHRLIETELPPEKLDEMETLLIDAENAVYHAAVEYGMKYGNRQPDQRAKKMSRDQPRLKSRIRFITMNCSE